MPHTTVDSARQTILRYLRANPTIQFKEAAAHFGCSPSLISKLAKRYGIPAPRLSRIRNFKAEEAR